MLKFQKEYQLLLKSIGFYIDRVSNNEMGEIIASHQIKNNNKNVDNDFANIKKLLFDDEMNWFLLKNNKDNIVACAAIKVFPNNIWYMNEFFSFEKNCGAYLLISLLNDYSHSLFYLNSDWTQPESLNNYYRQLKFGLTEKIIHRDHYDVHYFYRNFTLSKQQLNDFINQEFV